VNAPLTQPTQVYQHTGEVTELLRLQLERDTASFRRGLWQRRQLDSGIILALRRNPRLERWDLAIVRESAPSEVGEQFRWEAEVRRLQLALGCSSWVRGDDVHQAEGGVAAAFVSPLGLR
jgi:hypothetical protein